MSSYLLDTDAVIDHLLGMPTTRALVQWLHSDGHTLCVRDVVIAEVHAGLLPRHREAAQTLLAACTFLPADAVMAQQAGNWRYAWARQGVQISTTDALVAATAHAHGAIIITGNVKDYPMPELTIHPLTRRS
jgi:predicted nucleic acid-binding protein